MAGEEYTALDCAEREAQAVGNLAVFETRDMHKKRNPVIAWQTIYDTVYLLAVVGVLCYVVLELLGLVYVKEIVCVVNECLVTYHLAVVVYENVAHYGVYPTFEICVGRVFLHIAQCL